MRKVGRVRRGRKLLAVIIGVLTLIVCITALTIQTGASAFTGVYSYDPQTTHPSTLLIKAPPEIALRTRLQQQIAKDRTYPKDAAAPIVEAEPVWVDVDLHHGGTASVKLKLTYENGTERMETFSVPSFKQSGINLPLVPYTVFAIEYGWLGECVPTAPSVSNCPLDFSVEGALR